MEEKNQWLDLTQEEVLEPELPICDPHHHLWDYKRPTNPAGSRYLMDELMEDIAGGHNIVSTVFIECGSMFRAGGPEAMRPVGETEFVNGIAAMSASGTYGPTRVAAGIVGFADLTLGDDVVPVLEAHIRAGGGRFRGIRYAAGWDASREVRNSHFNPPQSLYLQEDFRKGFARLAPLNLSFDAWLYHPQIPELTDLARAYPDTTIILDHFGGPLGVGPYADRREEVFEQWKADIAGLADCPNVMAKLGGVNMKVNGFDWHKRERPPTSQELLEATGRYYTYCIEQFGTERCMFESNFPVDKESCSYNVIWNMFKKLTADFSKDERARLFHDNAARVYRID